MDKMLKESVAALFCHVIKLDNKDLDVERPLFAQYMNENFDATKEEASDLFDEVMEKEYNIDTQIAMIANGLTNQTSAKMSLLKQLNHIMIKSKLEDEDYELFDKVKEALFS